MFLGPGPESCVLLGVLVLVLALVLVLVFVVVLVLALVLVLVLVVEFAYLKYLIVIGILVFSEGCGVASSQSISATLVQS